MFNNNEVNDIDKSEVTHKSNIFSRMIKNNLSNQELMIEILDVNPE